jgi:bifunctional non-homologous end joining protein LigD
VALDETGRPKFNDLLFGRRDPTYIAFDVLFVEGEDVRAAPLKDRKALLDKVVRRYRLQGSEPFFGEGRPLFSAVCKLDLEGIVAKRLAGLRTTNQVVQDTQSELFAKSGSGRAIRAPLCLTSR